MMAAHKLLHGLPEPYREVFTLRTFGELDHHQIGSLFGKSDSWARVTYYRSRQMLAQKAKESEMMKNKCNIVLNLMPLVIDDAASEESSTFVQEHVEVCKSCMLVWND